MNAVGMHWCIIMVLMWISPTMLDIVSVSIFPIYFEFGWKICLFPCAWFWQSFICAGYTIVKMSSPSTLYFLVLRRHHLKRKKIILMKFLYHFFFYGSHVVCHILNLFLSQSEKDVLLCSIPDMGQGVCLLLVKLHNYSSIICWKHKPCFTVFLSESNWLYSYLCIYLNLLFCFTGSFAIFISTPPLPSWM